MHSVTLAEAGSTIPRNDQNMLYSFDMKRNVEQIQQRIHDAALRCGRDPEDITLMAVTKTRSLNEISQVLACGIGLIGENRVQELQEKAPFLDTVRIHCIGPLQSNKVKAAVRYADCIQTVSREKIIRLIQRHAQDQSKMMDVMIEFNTSQEAQKHGLTSRDDLLSLVELIGTMDHLRLTGLMTMGPLGGGEKDIRRSFSRLFELRENVYQRFPELSGNMLLSMGMSGDFEIAVEEGSDMLRVGSALFAQEQS